MKADHSPPGPFFSFYGRLQARNFWPVVLAIQFPLWTILLLVPFAWEFLRTKEEQGFFEAYGYIAALLLTSVAHRGYCRLLAVSIELQGMGLWSCSGTNAVGR